MSGEAIADGFPHGFQPVLFPLPRTPQFPMIGMVDHVVACYRRITGDPSDGDPRVPAIFFAKAPTMKLDHPLINAYAGLLGRALVHSWMGTLDSQIAYYDPETDPAYPVGQRPRIYIFWHEYILQPFYVRGHCNLSMLLSKHRDADILNQAARLGGFDVVRGSTRRGGTAALRQLLDRGELQHLAITPDGPRGPRRQLAQGPIYLASKLQMPLVLLGFGFDRPWRAKSWDRFAIPRPGSRSRVVVSPEIWVPSKLDRDGQEHYRQRIESLLSRLTSEAEAWAASGRRIAGQYPLLPGPIQPWRMRYFRPAHVCSGPAPLCHSSDADAA